MLLSYSLIIIISALGSVLTFFSGFGLGTILLPVFSIFFPFELALIMTAIVHLLNGIFKFILIGKNADWRIVIWFGIGAIVFSFIGSYILSLQTQLPVLFSYEIFGIHCKVAVYKFCIGLILLILTLIELRALSIKLIPKGEHLIVGGILSGFIGGITGSQGAIRSYFLKQANLSPIRYAATGTVISLLIDFTRVPTYLSEIIVTDSKLDYTVIMIATLSAMLGAVLGKFYIKKTSIRSFDLIIGVCLTIYALMLILGFT